MSEQRLQIFFHDPDHQCIEICSCNNLPTVLLDTVTDRVGEPDKAAAGPPASQLSGFSSAMACNPALPLALRPHKHKVAASWPARAQSDDASMARDSMESSCTPRRSPGPSGALSDTALP